MTVIVRSLCFGILLGVALILIDALAMPPIT